MATLTPQTRNSPTLTATTKSSSGGLVIGNPIGLLLALTYAASSGGSVSGTTLTAEIKN